jgi:hypothetical protein
MTGLGMMEVAEGLEVTKHSLCFQKLSCLLQETDREGADFRAERDWL